MLTKNFSKKEFSCKCCGKLKYNKEFLIRLQILRNLVEKPIIINSGYRCEINEKRVNGKGNHIKGNSADIRTSDRKDMELLKKYANKVFEDGGIGIYSNFIHVDLNGKRRW